MEYIQKLRVKESNCVYISSLERYLAAEINIPPLRSIENLLIIRKRLKIEDIYNLLNTNRKPWSPDNMVTQFFRSWTPRSGRKQNSAITAIEKIFVNRNVKIKKACLLNTIREPWSSTRWRNFWCRRP